jgi:hypothetical protein
MKIVPSYSALARIFAFGTMLIFGAPVQAQTDLLLSWNDGPVAHPRLCHPGRRWRRAPPGRRTWSFLETL